MDDLNRKLTVLSKNMGLEGAKTFMNILAKDQEFVNAMETEAGKHVLVLLVDRAETNMSEILNMKAPSCSDCELLCSKMRLEATVALISSIVKKINAHSERSSKFNSI